MTDDLTSTYLVIHSPGALPYNLDNGTTTLEEAIAENARLASEDAGSDDLDDPGTEAREALARRLTDEATAKLRHVGDSYRETVTGGVVYELAELPDDHSTVRDGWGY